MRRRRLIVGLGSVSVGAGLMTGSGAFSNVQADRGVSLAVVKDPEAYLGLDERIDGERSRIGDGVLRLRLPGLSEEAEGNGLGTDSVYTFDDTGFVITNGGTEKVDLYVHQEESEGPEISIFEHDDPNREPITSENPYSFGVGEQLTVGIRVDTHGVDVRENMYEETLTITTDHEWDPR